MSTEISAFEPHVGTVPFRAKFLLEGPTITPIAPLGITHFCNTTSQIERSYLDKPKVTLRDSPAARYTQSNPFKAEGGDFADAGSET